MTKNIFYFYFFKLDERKIELVNGWNNGSFRVDTAAATGIIFSFYSLDDDPDWNFFSGLIISPSGLIYCDIFMPAYSPNLYQTSCPYNLVVQVSLKKILLENYFIF